MSIPAAILPFRGSFDFAVSREAMRFEVHDSITSIYGEWLALERRCPDATIFQSADWCRAWVDASAAAGVAECLRIVTVRRDDRLVLLWPLSIRRLSMFRILHSLAEPATQYSDVLLDPDEDRIPLLALAWEQIRNWQDIDVIELRRVRDGTAIARLPEVRLYDVASSEASAPLLDFRRLKDSTAAEQRTSRTRNALRRHLRQLAAFGEVTFDVIETPEAQTAALAEAFALKRQWQRDKSMVSAGYAHAASEDSLTRLARDGQLFAVRLLVGDQTAAIEIGAIRNGRYWSLVQSYDSRYAKHAPGRLLFWQLLERCPEFSIDVFDFLAPADRHKVEWSNGAVAIRDYLMPVSLKGWAAVSYLSNVKPKLREFYFRLPAVLRRQAARLVHGLS